ncbi:MAG: hypothetical protein AAFP77_06870 [Bacteroidota bacterium]
MKKILFLLGVFTFLSALSINPAEAAVLHPIKQQEQTESVEKAERRLSKKELRQERRAQRKSFRKALREQLRQARKSGKVDDVELILLVLLALIIAPLAMFIYDGYASDRFWLTLVLWLAGLLLVGLLGFLGSLAVLASVIYTLYVILSESL